MNLSELLLVVFDLECKLFMRMEAYYLLKQKPAAEQSFSVNERQLLNADIQNTFAQLIKTIKQASPKLTDEDVIFCCLAKSGLDSAAVCRYLGSVGKQAVNQRKYRIKQKMKETECDWLFDIIFAAK